MIVSNGWCLGQATPVPQLRPFCCFDFSKKLTKFSFVFGWGSTSLYNDNNNKPSVSLNQSRKSSNLQCCRCGNNDGNNATESSSLEWDWNRWNQHFSEIEQAESYAAVLKFQLEDAIEREEFQEAAKLKMAIAEATSKDSVAEIMSQLKNAIDEERYHDASKLCKYTGSGLVGWWVGYSTDSTDLFGRLVRITPGVGRFVGRSYSPSQLVNASPGTPLFEIFVVKDADERYVMQVVYLQRAKNRSANSTVSPSKSVKSPSTPDVDNTSVEDVQGNEVTAEKSENEVKADKSELKGIDIEEATEEGIKSVINFLKDKIPGLKVKVMNTEATGEMIDDVVKQLMQEDDETTETNENSDDEVDKLEMTQSNENSDDEVDKLEKTDSSDPSEDGNDSDLKLVIGGVVHNNEDTLTKKKYERIPAEIKNMERDSFVLHVPERSGHYEGKETRELEVNEKLKDKIREAAKSFADLLKTSASEEAFLRAVGKVSSRVSRDAREILKMAVRRAQKESELSEHTTFSRITSSNSDLDPFDGLYVGAFGPYKTEVVQLRRKFGCWGGADDKSSDMDFFEYVEAVKLTGNVGDPAGQVVFRAKIGKGSRNTNRGIYPDEFGVIARYKGQGRMAELGSRNRQWVDGELLQLNRKGIGPLLRGADLGFLYITSKRSFLVLFNRVTLPE